MNLFGSEFILELLDDVLIEGEAFVVSDRNVTLSGVLQDKTTFEFFLTDSSFVDGHFFQDNATLTVTLQTTSSVSINDICAAISLGSTDLAFDTNGDGQVSNEDVLFSLSAVGSLLGDLDLDGTVGFGDFLRLSSNFGGTDADYFSGDLNCDDEVSFGDFLMLSNSFGQSFAADAKSVPEPVERWLLVLLVSVLGLVRRNRR